MLSIAKCLIKTISIYWQVYRLTAVRFVRVVKTVKITIAQPLLQYTLAIGTSHFTAITRLNSCTCAAHTLAREFSVNAACMKTIVFMMVKQALVGRLHI
jgi:hypothetical protein